MTIVFALAFLGLGSGVYWLIGGRSSAGSSPLSSSPTTAVENPAAKAGAKPNAYNKYIEITGVRFSADPKSKKPVVTFVIVNHLGATIEGLGGNVTVWGRTQKSEEDAAGSFSFKTSVGPFESKELSAPLNTKKQMVELPDWQNVSTDVQITSPSVS
jgi:hypothetical protein